MLIVKIIEKYTMQSVRELHLFLCSFSQAIFTSSIFSVHSSVSLSTNFFLHLHFYNLIILQHHMIYRIRIHNYQDSKYIPHHIHLCQSILYIHTCIYHHSTLFIVTKTCIQSTFTLTRFMPFYVSCFISCWHQIEHFKI